MRSSSWVAVRVMVVVMMGWSFLLGTHNYRSFLRIWNKSFLGVGGCCCCCCVLLEGRSMFIIIFSWYLDLKMGDPWYVVGFEIRVFLELKLWSFWIGRASFFSDLKAGFLLTHWLETKINKTQNDYTSMYLTQSSKPRNSWILCEFFFNKNRFDLCL